MEFENDIDKARFFTAWHWQYQYVGDDEDLAGHADRFREWLEMYKILKEDLSK